MPRVTLLGLEESVYTRIARLALEEKGVAYRLEEMNVFVDGGPPSSYLERHPFGRIPCLLHDDFCLYETAAITRYVDERFAGPALQPTDPEGRARTSQILGVLDAYAYRPMIWGLFVQRVVLPERGQKPDETVVAAAADRAAVVLDQLATWLGRAEYLLGDAPSLADLHAFPMLLYLSRTPEGATLLEPHADLRLWQGRMEERDSVKATRSRYG